MMRNCLFFSLQIRIDNLWDSKIYLLTASTSTRHTFNPVCANRIQRLIIKFIWFPLRLITNNTRRSWLRRQKRRNFTFSSTTRFKVDGILFMNFCQNFSYHYFLLRLLSSTIQHSCSMQSTRVITFPLNAITCLLNFLSQSVSLYFSLSLSFASKARLGFRFRYELRSDFHPKKEYYNLSRKDFRQARGARKLCFSLVLFSYNLR